MSRMARKGSESGVYHIMFRGNELRDVFIDDDDRNRFLQTLNEKSKEENFDVYAYCLMDNHVHLLLNGEHQQPGNLVKRINTSYVYYFNKKYGRIGHLFHDRYKSEPVETEAYLLEAVRYIHNNPVKAGMVGKVEDYPWSSFQLYVEGRQNSGNFIKIEYILEMFSKDFKESLKLFSEFSGRVSEYKLADIVEKEKVIGNELIGELEIKEYISKYLKKIGLSQKDLKLKAFSDVRNELIIQLKIKTDLSVRQIALLLDLNRGVVQRVCQGTVP